LKFSKDISSFGLQYMLDDDKQDYDNDIKLLYYGEWNVVIQLQW